MAQAKKLKLQKAQVNDFEAARYETVAQKIKVPVKGYKYYQPVAVLITFELEKRNKALKIVNKTGKSFTAVINDSLDLMLYSKGLINIEDINPDLVDLIKMIYKPNKKITKKQK